MRSAVSEKHRNALLLAVALCFLAALAATYVYLSLAVGFGNR